MYICQETCKNESLFLCTILCSNKIHTNNIFQTARMAVPKLLKIAVGVAVYKEYTSTSVFTLYRLCCPWRKSEAQIPIVVSACVNRNLELKISYCDSLKGCKRKSLVRKLCCLYGKVGERDKENSSHTLDLYEIKSESWIGDVSRWP